MLISTDYKEKILFVFFNLNIIERFLALEIITDISAQKQTVFHRETFPLKETNADTRLSNTSIVPFYSPSLLDM